VQAYAVPVNGKLPLRYDFVEFLNFTLRVLGPQILDTVHCTSSSL
jgi:hypothetical protein